MSHELALVSTAVTASSACNLVTSGFFLILLHTQSTRACEVVEEDIKAWVAGALPQVVSGKCWYRSWLDIAYLTGTTLLTNPSCAT
jgi:hypothetical protein